MSGPTLAIETATPVCSVVLRLPGSAPVERRAEGKGVHSTRLFGFIGALLEESGLRVTDLKAVVMGVGPGSYTGLRIGTAAVKGLLFGTGVPLFGVDSLHALLHSPHLPPSTNHPPPTTHAVIDARRQHLYHSDGGVSELRTLDEVAARIRPGDRVVGTGWNRLPEAVLATCTGSGTEAVGALGVLAAHDAGQSVRLDLSRFEPNYGNFGL